MAGTASQTWTLALTFAVLFLDTAFSGGQGLPRPCNDGMVLKGNIEGDVEHTAGVCILYFARVNGSVFSSNGTDLLLKASTVNAGVRTSGTAFVSVIGSDLTAFQSAGAQNIQILYGHFFGNFAVANVSDLVNVQSSTIGAVNARGMVGDLVLDGNLLNGGVDVRDGNGQVTIMGNDVVGGLEAHNLNGSVVVELNNFAGALAATNISGDLLMQGMGINGGIESRDVRGAVKITGNDINGSVQVTDVESLHMLLNNAEGGFIVSDVSGDLNLEENTLNGGIELRGLGGSAAVQGNHAEGRLFCQGLSFPLIANQLNFENTINENIEGECA